MTFPSKGVFYQKLHAEKYKAHTISILVPLVYEVEATHLIPTSIDDSFKSTALSKFRKSYIFTAAPTATIKSNPETEMDSISASRFLKSVRGFAKRTSQDITFLSKPAEIT